MDVSNKLSDVQGCLAEQGIDGWLIYDFRRSNDIACDFLGLSHETMLTRRFYYWVPSHGEPQKLVHRVEEDHLNHLPGAKTVYSSWKELEEGVRSLLQGSQKVAMEYSPNNAIPTLSKVDGGTLEFVRSLGVEVLSSAALLQRESVLSQEQLESHYYAAETVDTAVARAWDFIREALRTGRELSEYQVQQHILAYFRERGCINHGDPIVAVNGHAADPHYTPKKEGSSRIEAGQWILIDLWCKQDLSHAVYADITRVGVAASQPSSRHQEVFDIVKRARDAGAELVRTRFDQGKTILGCEVDQACRDVIEQAGYGRYFVHRTGHNIDTRDHGSGANIDNLETRDSRCLLPGTCFSIEPGIYLPGDFGVRLEYDVYVHPDSRVEITGGIQNAIECLME